jgi:O-antigen ligase
MNLRAIWSFIAGDSRIAPAAVALAVGVVLVLERQLPASGPGAGGVFIAIIAAGLVAGVFERTG